MKIGGWHIEGFGIFQDFGVRLDGGLTLFLGPNEAGKSTAFGFLRAMLFGFPSRRSRNPQYQPLRGGRHGGRLLLQGPQGEIVVERIAGRKNGVLLNGKEAAEQELQTLLGGADENVFCSVFAFSIKEMQSLEWLKAEQIRERIFSAGIAGAGACARQVIDALDAEANLNFRPRGNSRVKALTGQIEQARRRLKVARDEAERYLTREQEAGKWTERAAAFSAEETGLRLEERALEQALEAWSRREKARLEMAALEPMDRFPADPEIRLAALRERVEAAQSVLAYCEQDVRAKQAQRSQMVFHQDLDELYELVEDFHGKLALHRERLAGLAALRSTKPPHWSVWAIGGLLLALAGGWLAGQGFLSFGIVLVLADLAAAAYLIRRSASRKAQVAALENKIADWEKPVQSWLSSVSTAGRLISEFTNLRGRCQKERENRVRATHLDDACAGSQANLGAARKKLAEAAEALRALFGEAGAGDEAEFHVRLGAFKRRQELAALIQEQDAGMAEPDRPEQLPGELIRIREKLAEVQNLRDEAVGEQRLADAERLRIAESDTIPALQSELESLSSDLEAAMRQWRVATVARELVARALQEYTRTRQPAVLEEASNAFARVTAGAYERILQDDNSETLVVVDRNSQRKYPEELSRGTAEQLYLCLRLGLASEFARRSASLPLIMDDVLVNFDPERARAVAQELAYYSRDRQVLIFTCHPETARMFSGVAPETTVIRMERFGASPEEQEQEIGLEQAQAPRGA